jgi:hypothetical protein
VVVLPWTYIGEEPLNGAEAWVSGEHVREVAAQGPIITEELASLGICAPDQDRGGEVVGREVAEHAGGDRDDHCEHQHEC